MNEKEASEILDVFRASAQTILGHSIQTISPDTSISDAGIDSMARLEIVGLLEDHFHILLDDEALMEIKTITDLIEAVHQARRQETSLPEEAPNDGFTSGEVR